jgi:CcmD family protein
MRSKRCASTSYNAKPGGRRYSEGEDGMENLSFLFAAYTAVWVLLFVYVFVLSRRNRVLEREIEELRHLLQRGQKS